MSQQINLLLRRRRADAAILWAALGLVLTVAAIVGSWFYLSQSNAELQRQLTLAKSQSAGLRAEIQRYATSNDEAARIKAEIAVLQPQYEAIKGLVSDVRSGPLGRPDGYSAMLQTLADTRNAETWLTSIELRHRGRSIVLTGVALTEQAASTYAAQVNRALEGRSLSLQGMELVKQAERNDAQSATPAAIIFKLN